MKKFTNISSLQRFTLHFWFYSFQDIASGDSMLFAQRLPAEYVVCYGEIKQLSHFKVIISQEYKDQLYGHLSRAFTFTFMDISQELHLLYLNLQSHVIFFMMLDHQTFSLRWTHDCI